MTANPNAWFIAIRPKTLAAAVAPVAVGTAVAAHQGGAAVGPAAAALAGALLIQIGTNFANDYYDFVHGADTESRVGPTRAVAAGLITPAGMRAGTATAFLLAVAVGVYLTAVGGWPVVAIGLASIAAGVGYTAGGRRSLGYRGLGDLFVFVFFGPVAVAGTTYVQRLAWPPEALLAALPVGLLAVAILVVNNHRDAETDRLSGKQTLAVRFGGRFSRAEYVGLLLAAFAVPGLHWALGWNGPWVLLPWAAALLAGAPLRAVLAAPNGPALTRALGETARLMVAFSLLYAVGIAVGGSS